MTIWKPRLLQDKSFPWEEVLCSRIEEHFHLNRSCIICKKNILWRWDDSWKNSWRIMFVWVTPDRPLAETECDVKNIKEGIGHHHNYNLRLTNLKLLGLRGMLEQVLPLLQPLLPVLLLLGEMFLWRMFRSRVRSTRRNFMLWGQDRSLKSYGLTVNLTNLS